MFIHDYLEYYARNMADAPCVNQDGRVMTYGQVDQTSNQLANALLAGGLQKGQRVAVLGENSPEHFQVFMAASKVGAVVVPLNYRLAAAELAFVINDAAVQVLIVLKGLEPVLPTLTPLLNHAVQIVGVGVSELPDFGEWIAPHSTKKPSVSLTDNDELIQLYTSGTTGNPKGVVNSHRNVLALMTMNNTTTPARTNAGTSGIICAPLFHIGGAGSVFMGIYAGQQSLLHKMFNPLAVLDDIERHEVTAVFMVPAMIGAILQVPGVEKRDFSRLKQVFYGASPISETVLRAALETFQCDFVQMYGMTETTGTVIALSAEDHRKALAGNPELLRSAGRPSVGVQAKILDAEGNEVAIGDIGEIAIFSDTNMLGYFNLPEETAKTMNEGWVRTGDAGYMDADGYIFLKDRIKDMVVSGGENIYPVEVENALAKHPAVVDVAVVGVPDDKFGEALLAFVVLKAGSSLECDEMIDFCRDKIAGYKIPRQLKLIDELPRNPSGKILKKILREPYWAGRERAIG